MIATGIAWLTSQWARPIFKYGVIIAGALILVAIAVGWYQSKIHQAKKAGASEVTIDVQRDTIEKTEEARRLKEKADEKARTTPYDSNVDSLQRR